MNEKSAVSFVEFASLIASTFDTSASSITRETYCSDVPGWDSLGHSVLLSRLDKRLHLEIGEVDAEPEDTVGELFDKLMAISSGSFA